MVRNILRVACIAALLGCISGGLWAQDVVLTSRDGTITLEGTLRGYDGEFYRIETQFGALTVDAQGVVCSGPGCPNLTSYIADIRLSGAARMGAVLVPALVERFGMERGLQLRRIVQDDDHFRYDLSDPVDARVVARFHFRLSTTDEGFADLVADEADLAMALREVRPDEIQRGKEAGVGNLGGARRGRIIALDALVPVVSRANPVKRLTRAQIIAILSGEIANWVDVGGVDAPIKLYQRGPESGEAQALADQLRQTPAPIGQILNDNAALADAIARDPQGFGIAVYSELGAAKPLPMTGDCGRPLAAGQLSLKTEDYPLPSPLFLYTPARRLPLVAREFLTFLSSNAAQLVIRRAGFVDQTPATIPLAAQGQRLGNAILSAGEETDLDALQRMVRTLDQAARLTTTFRFRDGTSQMDAQSEGNVLQLARAIEAGQYDGRELIFAGFSDGQGRGEQNLRLSRNRARAALKAVKDAAVTADWSRLRLEETGFGEAMPLACDDENWGRKVNRRVEVWVR